ncbi:tRNA uridine 5-carboxymethylaminomethyl modification enzyme MnmG [Clostridium sp. CAG:594]|nr:tRNA uridine 5-carboxymethylaminomethyl modification enzyme MnmG [Clostridium sp. CAG:594]
MKYDVIVVGAGHAGCEAALACARMKKNTLLITINIDNIADMPCNPSIGGSAKGIVVREIDALGGEMGRNADKTLLQMKMLNRSKGPAVRSLRSQADKVTYKKEMLKTLRNTENLTIKEAIVSDLLVENNKIVGITTEDGETIYCKACILTTGTYLKADILVGDRRTPEGPHGEKRANFLSDNLEKLGFKLLRLKTGTPPRIERSSIDFSVLKREDGDDCKLTFSFDDIAYYDYKNQVPCYLTYTNLKTHKIIMNNLNKSAMYGGFYEKLGTGPRYCPSIEDKVVRFKDKERHQLFLEPESMYYDDIYLQGFSTSMPHDVQEDMVHSLKGLEHAKILRYAYAIEYDAIDPLQLKPSLETKVVENLFTAGQINGTSGYEEAAGQGIVAGINASLKLDNKEPLILSRSDAYIGVLIDDLVTKGTIEPYRLLTSRAEFRLLLRSDNADLRLSEKAYKIGLLSEERHNKLLNKIEEIKEIEEDIKNITFPKEKCNLSEYLKRPEVKIIDYVDKLNKKYSKEALEQVEINHKYEGYIIKAKKEAEKMIKLGKKQIPEDIDYEKVDNLATEARQKLEKIRPRTIDQATRISGVNPSDIAILMVYLKRFYNE